MMTEKPNRFDRATPRGKAFTLIELLVVLFVLLILAAIALPNVRKLISDQQVSRSARGITAYFDVARNRAISEGRQVGVLIERAGADARGRAHSIRLRQLVSVPPYTGDASNAVAVLQTNGTNPVINATFDPADNQLLALSASLVADPSITNDRDDPQAPIRNGDFIEFPGGRLVPFNMVFRDPAVAAATDPVIISFELTEPLTDLGTSSQAFPSSLRPIPADRAVKFKIHRRPIVSTVAPLDLPRGVAIDLNYSGIGVSGNQFAPDTDPMVIAPNVAIIFGADGKIDSVTEVDYSPTLLATPLPAVARIVPPRGQIFLCLGDADGVRQDNLFSQEKKAVANLLNLQSNWIVCNPSTGRVVASPFSTVGAIPAGVINDPTDASLDLAISQARFLANLSDTVDQE